MSTYEMQSATTPDPGGGAQTPGDANGEGAKEKAAAVVNQAQDQAGGVVDSAKDQAGDVLDEAKHQARDLVRETRGQLRSQADEQASTIAAQLSDAADQLKQMSEAADDADHPVVEATRQLGARVRQLSTRLEDGGYQRVVADTKRFARRRPLAFIGASIVAGIVVGRVLRNADTASLVDAAKPDSNGSNGAAEGDTSSLVNRDATPRRAAVAPIGAPAPASFVSTPTL